MALKSPARDLLVAVGVVGGLLLVLFVYTGNWPPVVVVESNSMMHVDVREYRDFQGTSRASDVPYGRFGTIDPGDLVLVKEVGGVKSIRTFADGGRDHYGSPGDVIVYSPGGGGGTPIIHRAMTFVYVSDQGGQKSYVVRWTPQWPEPDGARCTPSNSGNYTCAFTTATGVDIPQIGVRGMQPQHNGYITKGDNPATNTAADQTLFQFDNPGTPWNEDMKDRPVRIDWVQGVARGEIPWFGLIKLALTSGGEGRCYPVKNCEMGPHPYYVQIGNVVAPKDLWWMLLIGLLVVTVAPVSIDVAVAARHRAARKKGSDWTLLEGTTRDGPPPAGGASKTPEPAPKTGAGEGPPPG